VLVAQRRHETVVVAARVFVVARSALFLEDGFAELHALAVGRLRKFRRGKPGQVGRNVGPRLWLAEPCPGDDRVHFLAFPLQLGEVRELLDQIRFALRGQCRNHIARIADGSLAMAAAAVLQVQRGSMRGIRIELQCSANELIDAGRCGRDASTAEQRQSCQSCLRGTDEVAHGLQCPARSRKQVWGDPRNVAALSRIRSTRPRRGCGSLTRR
jgi:hypothetical protein